MIHARPTNPVLNLNYRKALPGALGATAAAYLAFTLIGGWWGLVASLLAATGVPLALHGLRRALFQDDSRDLDPAFIGRVSHEIRTPLNGILGLTQVLLRSPNDADERELLEMIHASGESLLRILNDLMDYSKIQSGTIRFEPEEFRPRRLVRQTVRTLAPQAHVKGLEIAFWIDPRVPQVVVGDPLRVRQVLSNLIVNAIKFTFEGEILVEVTKDPKTEEGTRIRFAVKDTGIGVSPDSLDDIAAAFVQGDNAPSDQGGLGLGLSISSELVERMGGSITVETEVGKGSTFAFDIVFEGERAAEEEEAHVSLAGLRTLVVDDSATERDVLSKNLAELDVEADAAGSFDEALEAVERSLAEERPYTAFFLDSHMAGADVFRLAAELSQRSSAPGVLMTLAHERFDSRELRDHGLFGQLTKPVATSHLARTIDILRRGAAVERPEQVQTQGMDRPLLAGLRVLLADDHPVNRTVVLRTLESAGSAVVPVANGREALERWAAGVFDVLLLDLEMPEVDGFTVAERIREAERQTGAHLPIVALTAHSGDENRDRCLSLGMDGFLSKPFTHGELTAAIREATKKSREPLPALDRPEALRRANDDPALLGELIDLFLQETPETLEALHACLAERDLHSVERLAHRVKGALLTLSARSAARAALDLETAARSADYEASEAAHARLRDELARLENELRQPAAGVSAS